MARWHKIKELTKKDETIYTRVSLIYQQHHFPVDIREHFSEWFEQQEWNVEVDENQLDAEPEIYKHAESLLRELLSRIDEMSKTVKDLVAKINLNTSHSALNERFNSSPLEFLITVRRCMEAEITLLDSMQEDDELKHGQTLSVDTEQKRQFQSRIDNLLLAIDSQEGLKPLVQTVERQFEQMKQKHNKFLIEDRERDGKLQQLQHVMKIDGASKEIAKKESETLTKKKMEDTQNIISMQAHVRQYSNDAAESLAGVLKQAWELLDVWLTHQKLEMTGLTPAPDMAHLDALDNIFKLTNEQFIRVMQLQDRIQEEFDRVVIQNPNFSAINAELTNNLKIILEKHIDRMFVVERQPQRIKKITSRKSLCYNMIVRMLGGVSLGIDLNAPKVIARIFPEKDGKLKTALEYQGPHEDPKLIPCGIAEVGNGTTTFEKQRATGNLIAIFNSYQLRKVERIMNERIGKEERVTDQKYAMVYYTRVRVMNQDYQLKAVSLPICLNTSNSQEGPSKGTLIWEAAFPVMEREPWSFADREKVLWPEVVRVINALFERQTERPLTAEQLGYLAERLMDVKFGTDTTKMSVSKEKFLKDNLPGCSFTFWKWVFACLNLIRMRLKSEWKDGLIFGFIGRPLTRALLKGKPQGTFLLRFSDTSIEDTQSSEVPGCITVAVVHENPKKLGTEKEFYVKKHLHSDEINKHGLASILQAYVVKDPREPTKNVSMAKYLLSPYESTDAIKSIEVAFKDYIVEKEEKRDGYAKTKMKIEVDLEDQEDSKENAVKHESYMSPSSVYSATTVDSMMSPNPTDLDNDIAMMEIANAASPSVSDTSAMSQALSPLVVTEERDYSPVPELSSQYQEQILEMLDEQGIQLTAQTPSQILNLVQNTSGLQNTSGQAPVYYQQQGQQPNAAMQPNQGQPMPMRDVLEQVLDHVKIN